jgi:hypothetical protein
VAQARLFTDGVSINASAVGVADPWTPWAIPRSVIAAWWSAADPADGTVSTWTDRIGGAAPTAVSTPTRAATSFNSAYPGITYDGVDDLHVVAGVPSTIPTGTVAGEIWGVGSATATAANANIITYGGNGTRTRLLRRNATTSVLVVSDNSTNNIDAGANVMTSPFVVMGSWSGTAENGYINGTASTANPTTITSVDTLTTRLRIGASANTTTSQWWPGVIADVIVLKALSIALTLPGRATTLKQDMEGWAANTYGFASALPTTHPWRYQAP